MNNFVYLNLRVTKNRLDNNIIFYPQFYQSESSYLITWLRNKTHILSYFVIKAEIKLIFLLKLHYFKHFSCFKNLIHCFFFVIKNILSLFSELKNV